MKRVPLHKRFDSVLYAKAWLKAQEYAEKLPESEYKKAAFANAVAKLVSKIDTGLGGPSVRELMVISLSEEKTYSVDEAIRFAKPICFGELNIELAMKMFHSHETRDNDPKDLVLLGLPYEV